MIENAAPYINEWRISKYPSPNSKKKEVMFLENIKKNKVSRSANAKLMISTAPNRLLASALLLLSNKARYLGIKPPEIISDENKLIGDNKTVCVILNDEVSALVPKHHAISNSLKTPANLPIRPPVKSGRKSFFIICNTLVYIVPKLQSIAAQFYPMNKTGQWYKHSSAYYISHHFQD